MKNTKAVEDQDRSERDSGFVLICTLSIIFIISLAVILITVEKNDARNLKKLVQMEEIKQYCTDIYRKIVPDFVKRDKKVCISNMKTIEGAVELYLMEKNVQDRYQLTIKELVQKGFLKNSPVCPCCGKYGISIGHSAGGASGQTIVFCSKHDIIDDYTVSL